MTDGHSLMAKLTTPSPRLSSAPLIMSQTEPLSRDRERAKRSPWRSLYGLKRWKDLRWEVLTEAMFTCEKCGHLEGDTSKLVCDHIEPHRGDLILFWDRNNLQCLCAPCHSTEKQKEEQETPPGVWW